MSINKEDLAYEFVCDYLLRDVDVLDVAEFIADNFEDDADMNDAAMDRLVDDVYEQVNERLKNIEKGYI